MADGYLNFSCQTPTAVVLERFSGVSDPTIWVYQAECYFNFYGFSKDMWLSLPYLYFDGEALAWFNWLYRNKQFYDWKHFTDKLFYHYRRQTVTEFELPPVTDLLLQMDANLSRMHRHLDNIQNTLSSCSQKFYDAQARSDLTASLADKCDIEEVTEQEIVSALDKDNSNPKENSEVAYTMLEPQVANSMVLPERLNSRGSSSTSIHFPSRMISFGCIETLGPMLDSKNDLKDDPINYASKMFDEMPNKKIDMKVEHPVINDSENSASHIFDEMFQTVSAVKGEYNDLVLFNMQLGLGRARCSNEMSGMLSTCTYVQLINKGITDHFSRLGRASLILTLQLFTPDQYGLAFPFDPGSHILTMFLRVTRNFVFCVSSDNFDHDKLTMSTLWNSCIWVDNVLEQNLPGFLSYKSRVFGREEKLQGLLEALAARYSKQFLNILVNKDDVLLFAIFGIVRISKSALSYLVFDSGTNFFMVPIPVTTSYLYVRDSEKSLETVALSSYPVKVKALHLQGCSTCPDEGKAQHFNLYTLETCVLKFTVSASLGMLLLWNVDFGLALVSKYFFSNDTHTFTHNCAGPWVLRVYFICGGSRMISCSLITTIFWFTGILLISAYYRHCKFDGIDTKILFIPRQMFTASLILDLLTSSVDYFYVSGDVEPPVSSISFLVSTLLVLTVGLGEGHCIVYSIKAVVFLNNEIRIFDIGEGNDKPARKPMDEKMVVPCITFWTVGTDFLCGPWYTNLLPILEDTLSTVLVFSTTLTICYMPLNLHKSIVVMSSVKDLDQPFINDHQPLLWLGMQKGVSHVLHLGYGSVITPLPYGIETEKHVSLYESDSLSSLSLIYLNLEDKVRIQEGSIVMNGPRPIWAKQPNTELRDYVWDPG